MSIGLRAAELTFEGLPLHAFPNDQTDYSSHLQAEVVNIFSENGSVAIVAATAGGSMRVEMRLNEQQLRQLFEKGESPR